MTIKTVSYGVTINTGNYTSVRLDMSADVEPNETYSEALSKLKAVIHTEASAVKGVKDFYPSFPR